MFDPAPTLLTALDLIRDKRDGRAHSPQELDILVSGAVSGAIPDYQLAAWLMAVRLRGLTEAETAALTLAMARSGRTLDLSAIPGRKVDKHSTGGVGDKTTLVVAPMVAALGVPVAKLSGRALGHSGGTLDKLEAIPGFSVEMTVDRFVEQVGRIGIAIAGQTADMVPADKVLYALRDTTATVDSVPLIASSVMSKKLAAGADAIVLDVKAGRGAFVEDPEEASELARMLVAIGESAHRETVAYVTDMGQPLGRAVGNALEVEEAIEALRGDGPQDLKRLSLRLGAEMLRLAGAGSDLHLNEDRLRAALSDGRALRKFAELIQAQGGDPRVCEQSGLLPAAPWTQPLLAARAGRLSSVDALEIGLAAKTLGAGRTRKDEPIDLGVGLEVLKKVGDPVETGEPVAIIHARSQAEAAQVTARLAAAFAIKDQAQPRPLLLRRVAASGTEILAEAG